MKILNDNDQSSILPRAGIASGRARKPSSATARTTIRTKRALRTGSASNGFRRYGLDRRRRFDKRCERGRDPFGRERDPLRRERDPLRRESDEHFGADTQF